MSDRYFKVLVFKALGENHGKDEVCSGQKEYLTHDSFSSHKDWLSSHGCTQVIASQILTSVLMSSFLRDLLRTLLQRQIYGQLPHNCLSTASLRIQLGRRWEKRRFRNSPPTAQWHGIWINWFEELLIKKPPYSLNCQKIS